MGKRRNGEGSFGVKHVHGTEYQYYRDVSGKQIYARTMKELKEKINAWREDEKDKERLKHNPDGTLTIGEFAESWLELKRLSIKPKTYEGYEFAISIVNNNKYRFGRRQIKTIERDHVQRFIDELADDYSRETIQKTRMVLSQIYDEAVEKNLVNINIVKKTKVPSEENVVTKAKEIIILDKDDIDKLIKEANTINGDGTHTPCGKIGTYRYGIGSRAIIFLLQTGVRTGEMLALSWDDVDLDKKQIMIRRNLTNVKNRDKNSDKRYVNHIGTPKTKKSKRIVPLTDLAIDVLIYCKENSNSEYVFASKNGEPLNRRNLTRTLERMLNNADCRVKRCGLHALRHTFASRLIYNGVDIKVVSSLLGHDDISTTYNRYVHLIPNQDREAINMINM